MVWRVSTTCDPAGRRGTPPCGGSHGGGCCVVHVAVRLFLGGVWCGGREAHLHRLVSRQGMAHASKLGWSWTTLVAGVDGATGKWVVAVGASVAWASPAWSPVAAAFLWSWSSPGVNGVVTWVHATALAMSGADGNQGMGVISSLRSSVCVRLGLF
jgi:hypothetical protein